MISNLRLSCVISAFDKCLCFKWIVPSFCVKVNDNHMKFTGTAHKTNKDDRVHCCLSLNIICEPFCEPQLGSSDKAIYVRTK